MLDEEEEPEGSRRKKKNNEMNIAAAFEGGESRNYYKSSGRGGRGVEAAPAYINWGRIRAELPSEEVGRMRGRKIRFLPPGR